MPEETVKRCPACADVVGSEARKCPHCGELLADFKECPHCLERVRLVAKACRFCGFAFPEAPALPRSGDLRRALEGAIIDVAAPSGGEAPGESGIDFTVGATPLGSFFCNRSITGLVLAPMLRVTEHEVTLKSWSLLGLRSYEQRVPTARVASVRLVLGLFWGGIVIETFGGATGDIEITGLNKTEARDMAAIIEDNVLRRVPAQSQESHHAVRAEP
jgi:hypothetical protein